MKLEAQIEHKETNEQDTKASYLRNIQNGGTDITRYFIIKFKKYRNWVADCAAIKTRTLIRKIKLKHPQTLHKFLKIQNS